MLCFFDIDGTIWDYRNYIPESTRKAIKLAQENGHKCFLNTGRARAYVHNEDLLGIGFDGIVTSCGCMIEYRGETIYNKLLSRKECIRTLESTKRHGFRSILEGPEFLYMDRKDFEGDMFGEKVMREMGDRLLPITDNWGNWVMNKLSCECGTPTRDQCFEELSDIYDFMLHNEHIVEMVPKGHNKGTGIVEVCRLLGEDVSQTIAFGDSINDKEMLETAAISVAMGNATDVVKELSDHVTTQILDDGIWNAMMEYKLIS